MMFKVLMRVLIFAQLLLFSAVTLAVPVEWHLQDVYLEDGVQLVGSFVFDADSPILFATDGTSYSEGFQQVSIQAVKGSLVTDFQVPGDASIDYKYSNADYLQFGCGPECSLNGFDEVYRVYLDFASSLTNAGGTVDLNDANFLGAAPNFDYSYDFSLVSGSVVASVVPIPAAAWLFGSALVGLGYFRRRF